MTQEQLDTLVEMWVMCMDTSTNGFKIKRSVWQHNEKVEIFVSHDNILDVTLPSDCVSQTDEPKDIAEKVFELLDLIYKNGDQWLQDELDYHGDKLADRWDDERKSRLENN